MLKLNKTHEITRKVKHLDHKFHTRLYMAKGFYVPKIKNNKAMVEKI